MTKSANKPAVRYSEAYKMQVVRELERGHINIDQVRRKYGTACRATIRHWLRRYGNGTVGKIIRVETPKEINERISGGETSSASPRKKWNTSAF